jgi:cupin superfamily acireductone dioxygenase involved in methionine salvage
LEEKLLEEWREETMKNVEKIEIALEQLKLAYKNLASQERIVKEHEKVLEEAIKEQGSTTEPSSYIR